MSKKQNANNDLLENSQTFSLSAAEIKYLETLNKEKPDEKVFSENEILKHTVLKFNENTFVVYGPKIGAGFWGNAYLGSRYKKNADGFEENLCVIKTPKTSTKFRNAFNRITGLNEKMEEEGYRVKKVYGIGETLRIREKHHDKVLIMMPYLGQISLATLIKTPKKLKVISSSEWLYLFARLFQQLDIIHKKSEYIHNDIRPENIVVSFAKHDDKLYFTQINFLDLGMAQEMGQSGLCGDLNYQPPESVTIGLIVENIKMANVDIFALGKSLLKIIDVLLKNSDNEADRNIFEKCEKLFKKMSSFHPSHRPTLLECIERIKNINLLDQNVLAVYNNTINKTTYKIYETRTNDHLKFNLFPPKSTTEKKVEEPIPLQPNNTFRS